MKNNKRRGKLSLRENHSTNRPHIGHNTPHDTRQHNTRRLERPYLARTRQRTTQQRMQQAPCLAAHCLSRGRTNKGLVANIQLELLALVLVHNRRVQERPDLLRGSGHVAVEAVTVGRTPAVFPVELLDAQLPRHHSPQCASR